MGINSGNLLTVRSLSVITVVRKGDKTMNARMIAQVLERRGFDAYFVGGFVRDIIIGVDSNDVDIATNARPEQIESIFCMNHKVKLVGKAFGVVVVDGVEVATFRKDAYKGLDHKDVEVTCVDTIEEDLSRRDFTVNAMAMDLHSNLIDPFGGEKDLENRTIRFVGNPEDRIKEDPNRMLRACRFVAQLNGDTDQATRYAIMRNVDCLQYVAPERIRLEVLKAMKAKYASRFFDALYECGMLQHIFPSLRRCVYHTGGNYHPEDVFTHSMLTGDAISTSCPLTKLAGYLHDVGKPATYNVETGQFLEHEKVGALLVSRELTNLKFSNDEVKAVEGLVKMHMRTATVLTDKGVRRLLKKLVDNGVNYRDYLRLFLADRNANTGLDRMPSQDVRAMINKVEDQMSVETGITKVTDLAINGHDVMTLTGLQPGPEVGKVLDKLLDMVLADPRLNTKYNLEILLKYA
jgi:putative nucleotidyltransferase with HDIG domain